MTNQLARNQLTSQKIVQVLETIPTTEPRHVAKSVSVLMNGISIESMERTVAKASIVKEFAVIAKVHGSEPDKTLGVEFGKTVIELFPFLSPQEVSRAFRLQTANILPDSDKVQFYGKLSLPYMNAVLSNYVKYRKEIEVHIKKAENRAKRMIEQQDPVKLQQQKKALELKREKALVINQGSVVHMYECFLNDETCESDSYVYNWCNKIGLFSKLTTEKVEELSVMAKKNAINKERKAIENKKTKGDYDKYEIRGMKAKIEQISKASNTDLFNLELFKMCLNEVFTIAKNKNISLHQFRAGIVKLSMQQR